MPKIITPTLIIDGETFLPKSGFKVSIEQSMGTHSSFSVVFQTNATEGYNGILMNNSINYSGKKISIGVNDGELEYVGIITSVSLQKGIGASGAIVISGQGASILLSRSVQCFSYEEGTSFSQVISDTFNGHATDLLKTEIGTGTDIQLPYTVQYNESDFSFLQRMCARYGVWMYDNGRTFCVGRTGDQQLNGVYGQNIQNFGLATTLQSQNSGFKSQDWVNDSELEAVSSSFSAQNGHMYAGVVKSESEALFAKKENYSWNYNQNEYSGQQGLDHITKVDTLSKAANMIIASGTSEIVGLRVGDSLTIEGTSFSDKTRRDAFGSYMITKVAHRFDHSGNYENHFEGVPEGTEHPHYSAVFATPTAEEQRGKVLDNNDPDGLGRIKVQFPWQSHMGTTTPWIKMNTPYGGNGKGFYFIPEVDEEVLVGFENNNPEKPYVLSAGFNSSAKSGVADAENNIKSIRTRSGHTIELNDTDGEEKINIYDHEGSIITFDTQAKSLYITATESIEFQAKNIKMIAEENIDLQAQADINTASEGSTNIISESTLALQSALDTTINSDSNIAIEATSDATISSANTIVEGQASVEVNGAQTKVTGSALTEVSGAIVKIN
ncbi:type IV secretion protein Rhs [Cellulophaga baltica]|uniref:type VI secretion system Vgr family protein n=1 Tax=Cellulophaga TaxID=104264 RepID=UPI001C06A551|nr:MULTISPECIES: phage baseplate assembly protein V [Cellulophaga]MBU2997483.1 type IV secretion protein Rhs [Cellulophaga baltica]MDO6768880.1 phage baseplate assembly protein V [Cellulophaga sp. 1_MG-2023]